jgi:Flp pilus assembly protein TadD
LRLEPTLREPHKLLGFAFAIEDKPAEAEKHFRAALWTSPPNVHIDPTAGYYLAWCLQAQNRADAAREQYRVTDQVFRDPRVRADFLNGIRKEAWQLATDPDPNRRNGALALLRVQVVNQVLEEKDAAVLDTLAAAYAETGRFDKAVATARQALALTSVDQKASIEERLRLYEQNQPFRDVAQPR